VKIGTVKNTTIYKRRNKEATHHYHGSYFLVISHSQAMNKMYLTGYFFEDLRCPMIFFCNLLALQKNTFRRPFRNAIPLTLLTISYTYQ
jgi:hypothetical protein